VIITMVIFGTNTVLSSICLLHWNVTKYTYEQLKYFMSCC